ncbi:MAG TPA: LamG-like jellyroll fold domain-containing protein [Thermoguttaceae bacterium]|nr:LamG-like jellyroll fold domain-containing protein [Thermoguttaceae bacterium]
MSFGTKRFAGLALGLLAVFAASLATPAWAQDLTPVGYWALDDGQIDPFSTTAVDSSVNGNNGTLWNFPSTPTWGTGLFGGSLKFDGANDYVDMSNPTALDITGALSTSLWMGRLGPNASAYATLLGKNESGGNTNDGYYVNSRTDSHIVFGINPPSLLGTELPVELISSNVVLSGSWHHVSTVFEPGVRMAIYVDGVLDSELTENIPTAIRQVATPFVVGNLSGSASTTYAFNGYLDEVKVFNGALGTTQIQSLATAPSTPPGDPTTANLVAHWKLDDGVADPNAMSAADATTPATNGALENFDTPASWETTGRIDGALTFDGQSDRVNMGTSTELDNITGDVSMAFWIKPNGRGAAKYGPLAGKNMSGGQTNDGFFTDIVYDRSVNNAVVPQGTIEFGITSNDSNVLARSTTALSLTDDTWHHIAVTYDDGSRMAIYIDGELDGEMVFDIPDACDSTTTPFALGNLIPATTEVNYGYKGMMDDVRVYTGVLTDSEIWDLSHPPAPPSVPGDTNGDGYVDATDAATLATNWGAAVTNGATDGDFNADDVVNALDASILAANWNPAPPPGEEALGVPEPTTLVLLVGGLFGLLLRRQPSRRG